ncbi:MAG: hypothetical protein ABFD54_10305 [Armatimonadota bacterium]|nr:hypothetical protein [bacterium]
MKTFVLLSFVCLLAFYLATFGLCGTSDISSEDLLMATLSKADISALFE